MLRLVLFLASLVAWTIRALFLSRSEILVENLGLRKQVCALNRGRPRPPLDDVDRAFWVALRAFWPGWANRLIIGDPDPVAKWVRERFRDRWAKISQQNLRPGRPRIDQEIQRLLRLMAQDGWGAARRRTPSPVRVARGRVIGATQAGTLHRLAATSSGGPHNLAEPTPRTNNDEGQRRR